MQLLSLHDRLPQPLSVVRIGLTEPSPNRALTTPGWAEPKPNSCVLLPGPPNCHQPSPAAARSWLSLMSGIQLPISRMFGQSELCAQPGRSHQSQLSGLGYLPLTDF